MRKQHYDFAFGLGIVCSCSGTLRAAGLQLLSFPYDWITTTATDREEFEHDMVYRVREICDGFSTWFRKDDFKFLQHLPEISKDQYCNTRLKLVFNHDFITGVPYDVDFEKITAKYQRRGKRLLQCIRESKRILVLHVDRPDTSDVMRSDVCMQAKQELERHFTGKTFDMFLFSYEKGRSFADRKTEQVADGIVRVTFDYRDYSPGKKPHQVDLKLTGGLLSSLYSVRDYRTREEKRSFNQRKWQKRLKKAGCESRLQYSLEKVHAFLYGRYNPLPDICSRLRRKTFDQIMMLGFNCETAFRFVRKWNFLDSSLLAWANSRGLDDLVSALKNFGGIGAGEMKFLDESKMWRCENSRMAFHGKMDFAPAAPMPSQAELDADLADLRSRLKHLKEKFIRYCTNEKSTLFVYKLRREDAMGPNLKERLDSLEAALGQLGARNWKLLVVCEHCVLGKMPAGENRIFRSVIRFNPGDNATSRHLGDPAGWRRIYSEFAPAVIEKRKHAFKFEAPYAHD